MKNTLAEDSDDDEEFEEIERYRTKYSMSMIDNLNNIKKFGIREFVRKEKARWACPKCGGVVCVHRSACSKCGNKVELVFP